jgi:lipoprotein NlpI
MRKFLFPMAVPLLLLSAAVPASDTGSGAPALQDPRIQCLKMGGDPLADEAIRVCTEALASEKKKPGETALFYLYRGNAYAEKQLVDQAYSDYREALKHDGRLSQAYFGLGMLFLHEGDYQGAEQEFNKALELKPGYQDAKRYWPGSWPGKNCGSEIFRQRWRPKNGGIFARPPISIPNCLNPTPWPAPGFQPLLCMTIGPMSI